MSNLTRKQRQMLDAITTEWKNFDASPNNPVLKQLESRSLIEMQPDPLISQQDHVKYALSGIHGNWQVRRVS